MKRILYTFAALAALAAVGYAGYRHAQPDYPRPDSKLDARVLPTSEFANADASIAYYQARLRGDADDVKSYIALGQLYLQQARVTGDEFRYVPQAQEMIQEALRRAPDDIHALTLQGMLYNTLHQFESGLETARALLARHPDYAHAHGLVVDALVELGRYDEAVEAADRMVSLRPDINSYTRVAYLRELHGHTDGARDAMRLAADAGVNGSEERAWALYELGQAYLAEGDLARAGYLFEGILDERPAYLRAHIGLAHIALIQNDADAAIERLEAARGEAPHMGFDEALAEAYAIKGDARAEATALSQVRRDLERAEAMGEIVNMEMADFLADQRADLDDALRRIEIEYARRPTHMHVQETYAWVLHAQGRSAEAVPVLEKLLLQSPSDPMLHYRAAQIYAAANQPQRAAEQLRKALEGFLEAESPSAARDARARLALLQAR